MSNLEYYKALARVYDGEDTEENLKFTRSWVIGSYRDEVLTDWYVEFICQFVTTFVFAVLLSGLYISIMVLFAESVLK